MIVLKRILCCLGLLFMCLFLGVGYAAISKDMGVVGELDGVAQKFDIYISNIVEINSSNSNCVSTTIVKPTSFTNVMNTSRANGSVTYKVTIVNDSNVTYWYGGLKIPSDYESNNLIGESNGITIGLKDKIDDSSNTFNTSDWIPPNTERDFYVTYTCGSNALSYTITLVNFHFEIRIDAVHDDFLSILNNPDSYAIISAAFDKKYSNTGETVLGNIGNDSAVFNQLFGGNLVLNIDGIDKPVTLLIERENVDGSTKGDSYKPTGPTGCEYTLYITTDDLSSSNGEAKVYAISYTKAPDGTWYQLAELYEGSAPKADYDTTNNTYDGAFNVEKWNATANEYEVIDGLMYKVGYEQGDQYDKMKTIDDLMSTYDQDIFNDIDNKNFFKKVYDILKQNKNSFEPEVVNLRIAFEQAAPYYTIYNNGAEIKVKRNCSRAEIIPYLEAIQKALDYYNQVHS